MWFRRREQPRSPGGPSGPEQPGKAETALAYTAGARLLPLFFIHSFIHSCCGACDLPALCWILRTQGTGRV